MEFLSSVLEKDFLLSDFLPLSLDLKFLCAHHLLGVKISSVGTFLIAAIDRQLSGVSMLATDGTGVADYTFHCSTNGSTIAGSTARTLF